MPVVEWQHSLETSLFRTACIFESQDCNISSSSLDLQFPWSYVNKYDTMCQNYLWKVSIVYLLLYVSTVKLVVYWLNSGKATCVTVWFCFFFSHRLCLGTVMFLLGLFRIRFPQPLHCGSCWPAWELIQRLTVSNNVLLWVIPSRRNRIHAKTVKQTALLCRSMLETDGVGFIRHRASFYQLLRQNNPVAPPLPKLCCANPIRSGNAWVMGKKMKRLHNIF